ncbi:MAG: hypothetical protein HQM08_03490 [Candidatus Riflebacteria bacterium]|nr:hypothetical protein [Candidatus Riflebacteria bacterium]
MFSTKRLNLLIYFLAFLCGLYAFLHSSTRKIDLSRVESCLTAYSDFQKKHDSNLLEKRLNENGVDKKSFEKIIDRIIYYRLRQSSMQQALELLNAFKAGKRIVPENCDLAEFPKDFFQLDAEVLELIQSKPDLVKKVFEG